MSSSTGSELDALVGLESAKRVIRRLIAGEQPVHAILLYGERGSGKSVLAEALAKSWLCARPSPEGPCGDCAPCRTFEKGSNPDLLLVEPEGASNLILVDSIRGKEGDDTTAVRPFLRTGPLSARHKVVLIRRCHRMNASAANSLLKTLEEPFPYARFILETDSIGSLLATVVSRCVAVACELPDPETVRAAFPEASPELIAMASGAPGRIATLRAAGDAYEDIPRFAERLRHRPPREALAAASEWQSICEKIAKASGQNARGANAEALELLATVFGSSADFDPRWVQWTAQTHRRILGNGNAGLLYDALFTRLLVARRLTPVREPSTGRSE